VNVGAHPSYPDKENFGREIIPMKPPDITETVMKQIEELLEIAIIEKTILKHVKPHGALYNLASKNSTIAHAIGLAVKKIDPQLTIVGLSNSIMIDTWIDMGLIVAEEAFADRTYETDGSLRDRKFNNALITNPAQAAKQVMMIIKKGEIISVDGNTISINAQTICIHSDTKNALAIAKAVKDTEK
ncbi:MAG: 5-oxoprolinase subunit PxpA, partial [Candidatus Neomarinimicrobiota bacterium]